METIAEYNIMLQKLRTSLQGDYGKVAKEAKVSISTVMRVLRGDYVNHDIVKAAIRVNNRLIKEQKEIIEQSKHSK